MPDPKTNIGLTDADYQSPEVIDKVSQHLNLLDGEATVIPAESKEQPDDSKSTPPVPKIKAAEKEAPEPELTEDKSATDEPSLPDNYYRAALHQGWTAEEISDFLKTDPEKALKTFERIHKSTNELSRRFAQLGETALKVQQSQPQPQPQQQPQVQDFVDMKKIREEHGDSPLVDVIGTLNEGLKKVLAQRQEQPQPQSVAQPQVDRARYEEDMAIVQQLQYFFGDDDMKSYDDFYGASLDESGKMLMTVEHLTPGQQANRMAVIRLADRILAGSELQGEAMSVANALELAHLVITEKIREKAIRNNLAAKVIKQGKGLTLRPTGSKKDESGGPPKTEEELVDRTKARAEKLLKP